MKAKIEADNSQIYWQESSSIIKEVSSLSGAIMKESNGRGNLLQYQAILLMFVQRIHINYVAIENLMPTYLNFHSLNFSIITLLRPLLADFLLVLFLLKKSLTEKGINESEFLNLFNGLTASSLEKMNRLLSHEKSNSELRSSIIEAKRNLKSIGRIELTPQNMWEEIRKSTLNDYEGAYHIYSVLSQFEHFTNVSEKFMKPNLKATYELISITSEYISNGILFSLQLCNVNKNLSERTSLVLKSISESRRLI